jgi:sugar/nucleoside kinase (ribokinase family)
MPQQSSPRRGIACAGNWIVDHVKMIDHLPGRGMLGNTQSETAGTGGAPFNVIMDLARMGAPFPLVGLGVVGNDAGRDFIRETCRPFAIDISHLVTDPTAATSYTDVMTEIGSGDRVFFHCRGANARFNLEHVPIAKLTCRIFHLGYLLLLDRLDQPDAEFGTVAARLLKLLRDAGIKTSADVVSEESDRFQKIVPPALRHIDYLVLNEIEAGRTTGRTVRDAADKLSGPAVLEAVEALFELGEMELVIVHMPEGAYLRTRAGRRCAQGALALPEGYIQGKVGAGDAFCAGILYALHEGWDVAEAMHLGSCAAAASLAHPSSTDGMRPLPQLLELGRRYPEQEPPFKV